MIFSLVILIFIAIVAYFHYVQGIFSASLSAISAILAALIAVSYHEPLVNLVLKAKLADQAYGIALVVLFAVSYIILRLLFDRLIPGNVRVPLYVDKVGAAAAGIVAGIFSAGIFAIAAQTMPFGPTIAGYSRFTTGDRDVTAYVGGRTSEDLKIYDEMKLNQMDSSKASGMWIPADDVVIGLVNKVSDGGSLAGPVRLNDVHPNYLEELQGSRLGIQVGARHTAINSPEDQQITVAGVYRLDKIAQQRDAELEGLRAGNKPEPVNPAAGQSLLVVRINVTNGATDTDNKFRFSPGAVRLVEPAVKRSDGSVSQEAQDKFMIGTVETSAGAPILYLNRADDFLVSSSKGFDAAFVVDDDRVFEGDPKSENLKLKPGTFLSVKRMARDDLSGKPVETSIPPSDQYTVMRKKGLEPAAAAAPGEKAKSGTGGGAGGAVSASPLDVQNATAQLSDILFTAINTGGTSNGNATLASGSATLKDGKFSKMEINTTETIGRLGQGANTVKGLLEPAGKKLVQVHATAPKSGDAWEWADKLGQFQLVDSSGVKYNPCGAFAKVDQKGSQKMVAKYDADGTVTSINREDGKPTDVWLAFAIPTGKQITELQFNDQSVKKLSVKVP